MTDPVRAEEDPRLEYLPFVLIVTTNGVEVDLLLPPTPTANIHWAQTWKAMPCRCGTVHASCDAADLVLVIGARDHGLHYHPAGLVVFVVPRRTFRLADGAAQVVHGGTDTFAAWAADVLLNLVGPQSDPSWWRYDLADLKRMMGRARSWSCVSATGDLPSLASAIVERIPASADELHISISLPETVVLELADVTASLKAIQGAVRQDASIIVSCSWGRELRVTALHGVDVWDHRYSSS